MDFGVTCPLRGNDVMANLAFKINRTSASGSASRGNESISCPFLTPG